MHIDLWLSCPMLVVLVATTVATVTDMRWFKIYNAVTMPLIVSGLVYHAAVGRTAGFIDSLAGACVGGGALLVMYLVGGMGAGDVKLMAGVGAWLGMPAVFYVLTISLFATGAYAAILLALYGGVRRTVNNLRVIYYQARALCTHLGLEERTETLVRNGDTRRLIPYGAMTAVGVIVWFLFEGVTR